MNTICRYYIPGAQSGPNARKKQWPMYGARINIRWNVYQIPANVGLRFTLESGKCHNSCAVKLPKRVRFYNEPTWYIVQLWKLHLWREYGSWNHEANSHYRSLKMQCSPITYSYEQRINEIVKQNIYSFQIHAGSKNHLPHVCQSTSNEQR